jgi:hypothetical protein
MNLLGPTDLIHVFRDDFVGCLSGNREDQQLKRRHCEHKSAHDLLLEAVFTRPDDPSPLPRSPLSDSEDNARGFYNP